MKGSQAVVYSLVIGAAGTAGAASYYCLNNMNFTEALSFFSKEPSSSSATPPDSSITGPSYPSDLPQNPVVPKMPNAPDSFFYFENNEDYIETDDVNLHDDGYTDDNIIAFFEALSPNNPSKAKPPSNT